MANTLTAGKFGFSFEVSIRQPNSDSKITDTVRSGTPDFPAWSMIVTNGTGANKAQVHEHKAITLVTGASTTIDLKAFPSESFGTISLASVKEMSVRVRTPTTGAYLIVGNAATGPWAPWCSASAATENVHDLLVRTNPIDAWTVPATAALKIAATGASGASIKFDLSLLGN